MNDDTSHTVDDDMSPIVEGDDDTSHTIDDDDDTSSTVDDDTSSTVHEVTTPLWMMIYHCG